MTDQHDLKELGWTPMFQQQVLLEEWEALVPGRVFEVQRTGISVRFEGSGSKWHPSRIEHHLERVDGTLPRDEALHRSLTKQRLSLIARDQQPLLPPIERIIGEDEELWEKLGEKPSVAYQRYPKWKEDLAKEELVTVVFQINGRIRARAELAPGTPRNKLEETALDHPRIRELLAEKKPDKIVVVPDKLVNIVVG